MNTICKSMTIASKIKKYQKDYTIRCAGKDLEIPIIDIDCDAQTIFSDADAVKALLPKLRRELRSTFAGKKDDDSGLARKAQKRIEQERVNRAVKDMEGDWKEWVTESMILHSRRELSKMIHPQVTGKARKTKAKSKYKQD